MELVSALECARQLAVAALVDTIAVETPAAQAGRYGPGNPVWSPIYTGPGLVQRDTTRPASVEVAGSINQAEAYVGKIPVTVEVPKPCRVRVIASHDPALVGQVFAVTEALAANTFAVLRRLLLVHEPHQPN